MGGAADQCLAHDNSRWTKKVLLQIFIKHTFKMSSLLLSFSYLPSPILTSLLVNPDLWSLHVIPVLFKWFQKHSKCNIFFSFCIFNEYHRGGNSREVCLLLIEAISASGTSMRSASVLILHTHTFINSTSFFISAGFVTTDHIALSFEQSGAS